MRLLLDTSGYSQFMRGDSDARQALQRAEEIFMTPIILGELKAGFQKGRKRVENEDLLSQFLSSPRIVLVSLNEETAECYATIVSHLRKAGTPIPTNDAWIAATAMQYGVTVLTADAHFNQVVQVRVQYIS